MDSEMMRSFFLVFFTMITIVPAAQGEEVGSKDPKSVIAALVRLDTGSWGKFFANKPTILMRRYFTSAFNASWANAMTHDAEEPVLDGDPITGYQGVKSVRLISVDAGSSDGDFVTLSAHLLVASEGFTKPEPKTVTFNMRREGGGWKVDDMTSPVNGTIRNYFRTSYGK